MDDWRRAIVAADNGSMRLKHSLLLLLGVAATLCVAFFLGFLHGESPSTVLNELRQPASAIVRNADKAYAYRIDSNTERYDEEPRRIAGPIQLTSVQLASLKNLLSKPGNHDRDDVPACLPNPGIQLEFVRGSHVVDLDLCVTCARMTTKVDGKSVATGGANFDAIEIDLGQAMKQLFPRDPKVQALGTESPSIE